MANGYSHSRVFASLKSVVERIPGNLTTAEYLQVLDALLMKAVRPLILHTRYVTDMVAGMAGWQEANRRRKLSSGNHKEFRNRAMVWLMTYSAEDRADSFENLRLDRGLVLSMCTLFLNSTETYASACNARMKDADGKLLPLEDMLAYTQQIERAFAADRSLMSIRTDLIVWMARFTSYKDQVAEKYTRLALKTAQYDYVHYHNCAVPLDDVSQTYVMAVSRAVDRCDYRLGVLTTQVQYIFLTARTAIQKSRSKTYDDLEDHESSLAVESTEHDVDQRQRVQYLCRLSAILDHHGAARAYLGLTATP